MSIDHYAEAERGIAANVSGSYVTAEAVLALADCVADLTAVVRERWPLPSEPSDGLAHPPWAVDREAGALPVQGLSHVGLLNTHEAD